MHYIVYYEASYLRHCNAHHVSGDLRENVLNDITTRKWVHQVISRKQRLLLSYTEWDSGASGWVCTGNNNKRFSGLSQRPWTRLDTCDSIVPNVRIHEIFLALLRVHAWGSPVGYMY